MRGSFFDSSSSFCGSFIRYCYYLTWIVPKKARITKTKATTTRKAPTKLPLLSLLLLLLNLQKMTFAALASSRRIAVIGGGASGIFSAIAAAEQVATTITASSSSRKKAFPVEVIVLEATSKTLSKVSISGGGRCNVLHDTSKATSEILSGYPRGRKELTGLLQSRFTPLQAQEWFHNRGVTLKTESDGRMFPITDSSKTIIDALLKSAEDTGIVDIKKRYKVTKIEKNEDQAKFVVSTQTKEIPSSSASSSSSSSQREKVNKEEIFDAVILASGSAPMGYDIAVSAGHTLVPPVPSLFTLNTKHDIKEGGLLHGLAGVSVPYGRVSFQLSSPPPPPQETMSEKNENQQPQQKKKKKKKKNKYLIQEGPILVTHHGLSGPAVLKLSAFGAREFHQAKHRGEIIIHWAPKLGNNEDVFDALWSTKMSNPKRFVTTGCPLMYRSSGGGDGSIGQDASKNTNVVIPKRLWLAMVQASGFPTSNDDSSNEAESLSPSSSSLYCWGDAPKKLVRKLASMITDCRLEITGKGTFKEEFVTAGGVSLKEIDTRTMSSKVCPGLYLCGEVIDVDGITGGYNFMNCWSTGYVAGNSAADYVLSNMENDNEMIEL